MASSSSPAPEVDHQSMGSSSSEPPQSKILTLRSSDNIEFQVEESIAVQSGTIKNMVEDGYTVIPVMNIGSQVLTKILDYLMKHAEKTGSSEEELKEFDSEFVKMNFRELAVFVYAANFLHIAGLMNLLYQTFADRIKNKSVIAVRKIFNITNDYTPEEEAEVRAEHEWAHEGEFDDTVDDDDDDDDDVGDDTSDEEEESEVCGDEDTSEGETEIGGENSKAISGELGEKPWRNRSSEKLEVKRTCAEQEKSKNRRTEAWGYGWRDALATRFRSTSSGATRGAARQGQYAETVHLAL